MIIHLFDFCQYPFVLAVSEGQAKNEDSEVRYYDPENMVETSM
jgi:hypothetical protein